MDKRSFTAEQIPPSFKTSPALQAAFKDLNYAFLKAVEVAVQMRNVEPQAAMMLGLTHEELEVYATVDKEDWWEVAKIGMPLVLPRVKTVEDIREVIASGFSSPKMVGMLTRQLPLPTQKAKAA